MAKYFTIKDNDKLYKKIVADVNKIKDDQPYVKIGFPEENVESKTGASGLTVAQVATFHEFGTENIPERSFIRSAVAENRDKISKLIEGLKPSILQGSSLKALSIVGEYVQTLIKSKIQTGDSSWAELRPSTIRRKGSSKALIDTGQMLNSVRYVVKGKS